MCIRDSVYTAQTIPIRETFIKVKCWGTIKSIIRRFYYIVDKYVDTMIILNIKIIFRLTKMKLYRTLISPGVTHVTTCCKGGSLTTAGISTAKAFNKK